jgi:hypothetical protein
MPPPNGAWADIVQDWGFLVANTVVRSRRTYCTRYQRKINTSTYSTLNDTLQELGIIAPVVNPPV